MELTPGVTLIIAIVAVGAFVLLRWGLRHEASAPAEVRNAPVRSKEMPPRGHDESQKVVTWLLDRASDETGVRVADDALARQRIGEAAVKATKELQTEGVAEVNLPFLTADARGPRHFQIRFRRNADGTLERED